MRPADAYRLKYRSGTAEGQTLEPNDESNTALVDSLPEELLARILSPVDLKSLVQARAVCKAWRASVEGKAVSDLRATTTEPLIALIGGSESEGGGSEIMNLRIGRGAWFAGPPMPEFRRGHCVVAVGHKIYVVGGVKSRNDFGGAPAGVTLVYDVWTATWSAAPAPQSLRAARRGLRVSASKLNKGIPPPALSPPRAPQPPPPQVSSAASSATPAARRPTPPGRR